MTGDCVALNPSPTKSLITGTVTITLGCLALAIAGAEYFVFVDMAAGGKNVLGLSFGTTAYLGGYAGTGVVLICLGIWKLVRAGR